MYPKYIPTFTWIILVPMYNVCIVLTFKNEEIIKIVIFGQDY